MTGVAFHDILTVFPYDALAVLAGAELGVWIFGHFLKLTYLFVVFLNLCWQIFEERRLHVQGSWTTFLWTIDFLEIADLKDDIVVQT